MTADTFTLLSKYYVQGSRRTLRKLLGLSPEKIPYMKFKEIDLMHDLLEKKQPMRVLEYGCGFSTNYFPSLLPRGAQWVSVEHDRAWYEIMRDELKGHAAVALHYVGPDRPSWEFEGDYHSFKTYVDFPHHLEKFDLVLVDGMARQACIMRAHKLLKPGGLLVVHDANRSKYHALIQAFKHWLILEDFRKTAGGFGIASQDQPLDGLLNIKKHRQIWKMDTHVNNFFKFKYLLGKSGKQFRFQHSH